MSGISGIGMAGGMGSISPRTTLPVTAPSATATAASPSQGTSLETGRVETASRGNETYAMSQSSYSLSFEDSSNANDLAVMVMVLIQALLGQGEDEDEDKKNALVGLAAMMMISTMSEQTGKMTYTESHASQVGQASSTTNMSAVQAGAYSRGAGSATTATPGLGGNLDVVA